MKKILLLLFMLVNTFVFSQAPTKNQVRAEIDAKILTGGRRTTAESVRDVFNSIVDGYQDSLISGTNIKTINDSSLLGSGNLDVPSFYKVDDTLSGPRVVDGGNYTLGIENVTEFLLTTGSSILLKRKIGTSKFHLDDEAVFMVGELTSTVAAINGYYSHADSENHASAIWNWEDNPSGADLSFITFKADSAIFDSLGLYVNSTTDGIRFPRMTTAQRDAITGPTAGLLIYNNTTAVLNYYNGSSWLAGGGDALTSDPLSQFAATTSAELAGVISDETGTGVLVYSDSPTLTTPDLGTPTALVGTNITGTASGLTAGNVTTNANLTGEVTSVGNAAVLGSFASSSLSGALTNETGTGVAVFNDSPTLVTPNLGTPSTLVGTNITGTATGLTSGNVTTNANLTGGVTSVGNAATVVTNANLTGPITSVGNATSIASQTGTGTTFAMSVSPALTGTPTAPTAALATNTSQVATCEFVLANGGGDNMAISDLTMDGTYTVTAGGRAWTLDSAALVVRGIYDNKFAPAADVDFLTRLKTADNTTVFGISAYNGYTDITSLPYIALDDCDNFQASHFQFSTSAGYLLLNAFGGGATGLNIQDDVWVTGNHLAVGNSLWGSKTAALMVEGVGSTTGTTTALFENNSGTDMLRIVDDGNIFFGANENGINNIKVTLSSAQILALFTTPITLVAAPAAGYAIKIITASVSLVYGAATYNTSGVINIGTATAGSSQAYTATAIESNTSVNHNCRVTSAGVNTTQLIAAQALEIYSTVGNPTTGDGTADIYITYELIKL